jgi:hypothetical protein
MTTKNKVLVAGASGLVGVAAWLYRALRSTVPAVEGEARRHLLIEAVVIRSLHLRSLGANSGSRTATAFVIPSIGVRGLCLRGCP